MIPSNAPKPWQMIADTSVDEAAADFAAPPPEYGLTLWWGWDGPITEEVIARDLDAISARGIRCVTIEAGYGMSAPYLSSAWFETVRLAVAHARRRGMRVYLVDEGKYPSGFAGGKFSAERPDLRMQGLAVAERIAVAPGETLSRQLGLEVVGAIAVNLADQTSQPLDTGSGELRWKAPAGEWEVWLVDRGFRTSVTRAVSNPTRGKDAVNSLCDYLNPQATRQFIAFTHAQYAQALGEEFGHTVMGFRGDEPDFATTPWTPDLPDEFQRLKGYDVRPYLASFFAPTLTDEARRVRADYWDVWSDLFGEHFFRVQADWCAEHGLEYLVHLNHEDEMPKLVRSEGDFFKVLRHVQMPGVDAIWNQIWPGKVADFPKLASSAAHLFGRPRAFSESFAAYHIQPTVEQARWVIDHQFVRGINMLEVMFYPSSAADPERSGWLEADEVPAVAATVERAAYLLSLGRPAAQIALYFPTSSIWLGDETANARAWEIARQLLEQQRDFDFVDEQALASLLRLAGDTLANLSGQRYRAVIVPPVSAISQAALERLRAFAESGGGVVFLGPEPALVVEKTFLEATGPADVGWAIREPAGELTPRILEALPRPDVALDRPCAPVKALHRRWRDADVYFFFNESEEGQSRRVTLAGNGQAQAWDAASGRIEPLSGVTSKDGFVSMPLDLAPYETRFIVVGPVPVVAAMPQLGRLQ
ncbi:MAG: beta-galactosidase [Anaerolineae bacterium]|nr:beta-galactosidase [Anaerolineae bacterium]